MKTSSKHTIVASILLLLAALVFSPLNAFSTMPSDAELQSAVDKAYETFKDVKEGANADYIPILATVPSELFGVVIATKDGKIFSAGDIDYRFSIQSVSKPSQYSREGSTAPKQEPQVPVYSQVCSPFSQTPISTPHSLVSP